MDSILRDEIKTNLAFIKGVIEKSLYRKGKDQIELNDSELTELITMCWYLTHIQLELDNGEKITKAKQSTLNEMLAKIEELKKIL